MLLVSASFLLAVSPACGTGVAPQRRAGGAHGAGAAWGGCLSAVMCCPREAARVRAAGRCKVTVGEGDPVRPRACSQASPSSLGFVFPGSRGANVSTGEDGIFRKRGLLFLCHASGRQLGAGQVSPQGETAGRSAWASLGSFTGEGPPVGTSGSTLLFELKTRRGARDQRADEGQGHTKGTSVTFRSRAFGEEPGGAGPRGRRGFMRRKGRAPG